MSTDKRTIGVTNDNERLLSDLVASGHFGSELEAAKFAMAVAVKRQTQIGSAEGVGTKWNVGTVDPDGSLKSVIEALYPAAPEPYRLIEYLINEGLKQLGSADGLPPDVVGVLFDPARG